MSGNDLVVREGEVLEAPVTRFLAPAVSVAQALAAYEIKQQLIDRIMKPGQDYGVIPGTGKDAKPALLKAGAEKAVSFFGLDARLVDSEIICDWTGAQHDGEPFFFYRRTCQIWIGDRFIAAADGSCNSWEDKYRFRQGERVCPVCKKEAIIKGREDYGGGWLCFKKKGGCGSKFDDGDQRIEGQHVGRVKNPNPADLANTILKMADKRALVAAVLIACGLSDHFTQDIDEALEGEHAAGAPAARAAAPSGPEDIDQSTGQPSKAVVMIRPLSEEAVALVAQKLGIEMQPAANRIASDLGGGKTPKPMLVEEFDKYLESLAAAQS